MGLPLTKGGFISAIRQRAEAYKGGGDIKMKDFIRSFLKNNVSKWHGVALGINSEWKKLSAIVLGIDGYVYEILGPEIYEKCLVG